VVQMHLRSVLPCAAVMLRALSDRKCASKTHISRQENAQRGAAASSVTHLDVRRFVTQDRHRGEGYGGERPEEHYGTSHFAEWT